MTTFLAKLRFLLWPVTIALLVMLLLVLSLRWLLNIHFQVLTNEDLWVFVYPVLLVMVAWAGFLWRRIDRAIRRKWR